MSRAAALLILAALLPTIRVANAALMTACAALSGQLQPTGGPVFLPSFPAADPGPLKNAAFLYDESVVAIALIGCGETDRARRIGDAILAALDHDRFWHDGRLRNAYAAGPVTDRPVKLGGWWDAAQNRWLEDSYQVGSDTGNMAWAMLALLALDRAGMGAQYREGAARIGVWVAARADSRGPGGFTGGFIGWEPAPDSFTWKSTEHNTDLAAAFALLAVAGHDPVWAARATVARHFVEAMWDDGCACFVTGTIDDGATRNPVLALDANLWPLLALPGAAARYGKVWETVTARLGADGGFAYSEAGKGIWTEGTGQAALVARLTGRAGQSGALIATIEAERAPAGGFYATNLPELATGFADSTDPTAQRFYYRTPHLAATAWAALAERGFNPFTASAALPGDESAQER